MSGRSEVLLLGSFHFAQVAKESFDIARAQEQEEIKEICRRIKKFQPSAIAVEAAAHEQAVIDAAYAQFNLSDLEDGDKMRSKSLGTIRMYGEEHPIGYDNEVIQIGFRLGKSLGLSQVFAVDEDSEMDGGPFENPSMAVREAMDQLTAYVEGWEDKTLTGQMALVNSQEWSRLNHQVYVLVNESGTSEDYYGARPVAQWYERNLKIFSNLQRIAREYERIFLLYGAGHLHILRQLIEGDSRLRLIDTEEIVGKWEK